MIALSHPSELREQIAAGRWTAPTAGILDNRQQANLVVLPAAAADDFAEFADSTTWSNRSATVVMAGLLRGRYFGGPVGESRRDISVMSHAAVGGHASDQVICAGRPSRSSVVDMSF